MIQAMSCSLDAHTPWFQGAISSFEECISKIHSYCLISELLNDIILSLKNIMCMFYGENNCHFVKTGHITRGFSQVYGDVTVKCNFTVSFQSAPHIKSCSDKQAMSLS